jgi:hypothetical protein
MPGRGKPWKGVGFGNPDRIGSGAISDGSITEADLDSAVVAKLNGGAWEQIGKTVTGSDATTASVSFTTENLDGTRAQIKLVALLRLSGTDTLNIRFDNRADGAYSLEGSHSTGATHTAVNTSDTDGITSGKSITTNETTMIEVILSGNRNINAGNDQANYFYTEHESGVGYSTAGGSFQTTSITGITSFDIRTKNQIINILTGSTFVVYRLNIV